MKPGEQLRLPSSARSLGRWRYRQVRAIRRAVLHPLCQPVPPDRILALHTLRQYFFQITTLRHVVEFHETKILRSAVLEVPDSVARFLHRLAEGFDIWKVVHEILIQSAFHKVHDLLLQLSLCSLLGLVAALTIFLTVLRATG